MKHNVFYWLVVNCLILTSCSQNKKVHGDWEQNKVYKWNDYYKSNECFSVDFESELMLDVFPDVKFKWTRLSVTAEENGIEKGLISGMPVLNVYFTDLTNDGFPEICSTVNFGSGIIDSHIEVYDLKNDKKYTLWERMEYDYNLIMENDELLVEKRPYICNEDYSAETGKLIMEDDMLKFKQ